MTAKERWQCMSAIPIGFNAPQLAAIKELSIIFQSLIKSWHCWDWNCSYYNVEKQVPTDIQTPKQTTQTSPVIDAVSRLDRGPNKPLRGESDTNSRVSTGCADLNDSDGTINEGTVYFYSSPSSSRSEVTSCLSPWASNRDLNRLRVRRQNMRDIETTPPLLRDQHEILAPPKPTLFAFNKWSAYVTVRAIEYFQTESYILELLLMIKRGCGRVDPILPQRGLDRCAMWKGDIDLFGCPFLFIVKPDATQPLKVLVTRLIFFLFANEQEFAELSDLPNYAPLHMACSQSQCVRLTHISMEGYVRRPAPNYNPFDLSAPSIADMFSMDAVKHRFPEIQNL